MYILENEFLTVEISLKGAEIKRIFDKNIGKERLWNGNPDFWGRTSPVLFPIVGKVASNKYFINGKEYSLPQHGFARDENFTVTEQTDSMIWFELLSSEKTLTSYPFAFSLRIGYELSHSSVTVKWEVVNNGSSFMPFSIGAHPAFLTNLFDEDELSDSYLHLEKKDKIETYIFDNDSGLVRDEKEVIMPDLKLLPLSKDLFEEYPTLILEDETALTLKSYHHDHGVRLGFADFPYVGIWSPINALGEAAPFVCIEPWFGMADTSDVPGELSQKKGIQLLDAKEKFSTSYRMDFY